MAGQLEDPEHAHQADDAQDGKAHGLVRGLVLRADGRLGQVHRILFLSYHGGQGDEVGDNGDDVDDIHHVAEEVKFIGTSQEAHG